MVGSSGMRGMEFETNLSIDVSIRTPYNIPTPFSAEIAQLVERWTENPGVPSSILGLGTIYFK